mgnify:CR=1 FL=1
MDSNMLHAIALAENISRRAAAGERPTDPRERAIFEALGPHLCRMTLSLAQGMNRAGGSVPTGNNEDTSTDAASNVDTDDNTT